ncbi:hypothetical protein Pla123a_33820 [Posidoniimonas polymericola]|uniref:Porin n=1 Tax=Posidoniimonas polymericola TaxID=2528002 RepID=A0A5C5YH76_9BACT|nr:hypothetical protein [Posidoniimonas polymericola]TWT74558.1 hypothetical protein Pla123a_33820 [Posidoniimonas polymericola]
MKPLLTIAAVLCSTPLAFAQADFATGRRDSQFVLPEIKAALSPTHSGVGFAPVGRMMFRSAAITDAGEVTAFPGGSSYQVRFNTLAVEFTTVQTLHEQLEHFSGSIELMGQHLWNWSSGVEDKRPALRLGVQNAAFAMDVGHAPMADRGVLGPRPSPGTPPGPWRVVQYVAYGVRADDAGSDFRFDGLTDVAGRVFSETDRDELLIGPQLAVGAVAQRGGWLWDASLLAVAGYRRANTTQINGFGDDAVPGGLNNLLFLQPTYSRYGESHDTAAYLGEARLIGSYYFSPHLTLDLMANAVLAPESTEATQIVEYRAPDFGIGRTEDGLVVNGNVFVGLTYLR